MYIEKFCTLALSPFLCIREWPEPQRVLIQNNHMVICNPRIDFFYVIYLLSTHRNMPKSIH